jgi:hypothetical protein
MEDCQPVSLIIDVFTPSMCVANDHFTSGFLISQAIWRMTLPFTM